MVYSQSVQEARLGVNVPLTKIAQGIKQPDYVLKLLYPVIPTDEYGGQIITFNDSIYDDVDDLRADDGYYKSVTTGYDGRAFKLDTRGLSFRAGDRKLNTWKKRGINPDRLATSTLMNKAGLRHELQAAIKSTTITNYAPGNRIVLTPETNFRNQSVDPGTYIRAAASTIALTTGYEPNVIVFGREVYDAVSENRNVVGAGDFRSKDFLTTDAISSRYGFKKAVVCNAIWNSTGVKERIFGKHVVIARVNPAALENVDRYTPDQNVTEEEPSYGYTLAYLNHPQVRTPYYDRDRSATVWNMDFDRTLINPGVDDNGQITYGYLIANAA
jgi:hypothetical protein